MRPLPFREARWLHETRWLREALATREGLLVVSITPAGGAGRRAAAAKHRRMSEPIAQRTLVKSPPELWAEISDVEALARHLGAFGDIRITRMVPETAVSWEGDIARGTVELSAAGWGTKVTLRATATAPPAPESPAVAAAVEIEAPDTPSAAPGAPVIFTTPNATPSPASRAEGPSASTPLDRAPASKPADEPRWAGSVEQKVRDRYVGAMPTINLSDSRDHARDEPQPAPAEPATSEAPTAAATPTAPEAAPRPTADTDAGQPEQARAPRGFLARLKYWFTPPEDADAKATPAAVPDNTAHGTPTPATPAAIKSAPANDHADHASPEPLSAQTPQPATLESADTAVAATAEPDAAASDTVALADSDAQEPATAVDEGTIVGILTGVLDELGSAHHRPFSRG